MLSLCIPALLLYADRRTKAMARSGEDVITNVAAITWQPTENRGLAGSRLSQKPDAVKAIHTSAVAVLPGILLPRHSSSAAERTAKGLILAGAGSNLFDRLSRGSVSDMLRFPKAPGRLKNLVFNVADFMILSGAVLLALCKLLRKSAK